MKSSQGKARFGLHLLKSGVSVVALTAVAATLAAPAFAQTAAPATPAAPAASDTNAKGQEVVVVGVRRSLKTAQQIKRDADTIVDSITATDIGAFPDKSVAEALQRVAGITVSRFAATGDTAHFSAEPSGVLVRGLDQVRSEFNGRDTFSANSSRGLSWGDVSPELMSGVDTYKNQTADLIEGGIAGSINLRTRLPFDSKGQLIALSLDDSYGNLSRKNDPSLSGIYSNRWDTSLGEFGVMVNYAYSLVHTDSQGIQLGRIGKFAQDIFNTPVTANDPNGYAYIPTSVTYHDNNYTRTRNGVAAALQWQNHDHNMQASLQYNESKYNNAWEENTVAASAYGMWAVPASNIFYDQAQPNSSSSSYSQNVEAAPGTSFTFSPDGFFQTGIMNSKLLDSSAGGPFGTANGGAGFYAGCYDWAGKNDAQCRQAASIDTGTRYATTTEDTQDTSFNLKWEPNEKLKLNFDAQYVHATVDNYDMTVDEGTKAQATFDLTGKYPKVTLGMPTAAQNFAAVAGGFANPTNYNYNDLMDHAETSFGHEFATRLDGQYNFDGGWLNSLKVGVRYGDREQTINYATYNWNAVTQPWNGSPSIDTCYSVNSPCYDTSAIVVKPFGGKLMGGGVLSNDAGNLYAFTSFNAIKNRAGFANAFGQVGVSNNYNNYENTSVIPAENAAIDADNAAHVGQPGYPKPHIANLTGVTDPGWTALCDRSADITGTCYLQQEHDSVSEKTYAAYAVLKFGGPDKTIFGGTTVDGNIGLRWVQTDDASTGYITYPLASTTWAVPTNLTCSNTPDPVTHLAQPLDRQLGCFIGAPGVNGGNPVIPGATNLLNAVAFSNGSGSALTTSKTHINFLPSFNVKFGLNDQWILRFAASRAMSRPDMGYLKNYISVNAPSIDLTCATNAAFCIKNSSGQNTDYTPLFTASSGNPNLKSITADQFDVSVEDYFASVGSFTFDAFYKKFYNYIQFGNYLQNITNNGVTETLKINGPTNGQGASIRGFEVAYQRFFDFLPAPFNGFGIQTNYTHLANTGIKNPNLSNTSAGGDLSTGAGGVDASVQAIDPHALEGLSDDSYNIVGMYEKGAWAARVAYNWRSAYLVTAADCCVGDPVWEKAAGFLDASLRYKVNDNIEVSLSGSNLLGTNTVLEQQVEGDIPGITPNAPRKLLPDGSFRQDSTVQLGVRLKY